MTPRTGDRVQVVTEERLDQIDLDAYVSSLLFYPEYAEEYGTVASVTKDGHRRVLNVVLDNGERITDFEECFEAQY